MAASILAARAILTQRDIETMAPGMTGMVDGRHALDREQRDGARASDRWSLALRNLALTVDGGESPSWWSAGC